MCVLKGQVSPKVIIFSFFLLVGRERGGKKNKRKQNMAKFYDLGDEHIKII